MTRNRLATLSEREYFAFVARRPGMFIVPVTFNSVVSFLTGYDQHAMRHGGPGLAGWRDWLVNRRGRDCDHAWPGQVLHLALPHGWRNFLDLPPEDDARAVTVLFDLLDQFLAEPEPQSWRRDSNP